MDLMPGPDCNRCTTAARTRAHRIESVFRRSSEGSRCTRAARPTRARAPEQCHASGRHAILMRVSRPVLRGLLVVSFCAIVACSTLDGLTGADEPAPSPRVEPDAAVDAGGRIDAQTPRLSDASTIQDASGVADSATDSATLRDADAASPSCNGAVDCERVM